MNKQQLLLLRPMVSSSLWNWSCYGDFRTGATNAITAVAGAWIESVPLLIISGQ